MNFITKLFNKKQVDYPESVSYPEPYYYCGYEIEVKDGEHSKKTFCTKDDMTYEKYRECYKDDMTYEKYRECYKDDMTYEKYRECYKDVREKIKEDQKKLEAAVRNGDTFVVIGINLIRVSDFVAMRMNFGKMKNKS